MFAEVEVISLFLRSPVAGKKKNRFVFGQMAARESIGVGAFRAENLPFARVTSHLPIGAPSAEQKEKLSAPDMSLFA